MKSYAPAVAIEIRPMPVTNSYKQHTVVGLTSHQIAEKVGFAANIRDDPSKVKFSWGFTVNGKSCAVWDWRHSYREKRFSAYGPVRELRLIFGCHLQTETEMR